MPNHVCMFHGFSFTHIDRMRPDTDSMRRSLPSFFYFLPHDLGMNKRGDTIYNPLSVPY